MWNLVETNQYRQFYSICQRRKLSKRDIITYQNQILTNIPRFHAKHSLSQIDICLPSENRSICVLMTLSLFFCSAVSLFVLTCLFTPQLTDETKNSHQSFLPDFFFSQGNLLTFFPDSFLFTYHQPMRIFTETTRRN